jgi:hypothetical protein
VAVEGIDAEEASRRFFAASMALVGDLSRVAVGAFGRSVILFVPIAFLAGLIAGFTGFAERVSASEPITVLAVAAPALLLFGATFGIVLWRRLGGELGTFLDVIHWSDRESQQEWETAAPGTRVPRSPREARRWLADHPETDANRTRVLAATVMTGEVERARAILERYPSSTAFERHERAADAIALDLVSGREVPVPELDAAYSEIWEEHRVHALRCRSMMEGVAAVLSGGDWHAPIIRAVHVLPHDAVGAGRRRAWLPLFLTYAGIPLLVILIGLVVWTLLVGG